MSYVKHVAPAKQNQRQKAATGQKRNNAGGYSFTLDCFKTFERFLILGNEGGSYYASERKMTKNSCKSLDECLKADYVKTIDLIADISVSGRAIKNDPAIFALAYCSCNKKLEISKYAFSKLNDVCRIGTHLFQFVDTIKELKRGWGYLVRKSISNWYLNRSVLALSKQVTKYQQRNGWSHRDIIRLAHVKPNNAEQNEVFKYVVNKVPANENTYLKAVQEVQNADTKRQIELIGQFELPWEVLPTKVLNNPKVWESMLPTLGMNAVIRNLGKMSSINLLKPLSNAEEVIIKKLEDESLIKESRLHPFSILLAYKNYTNGGGYLGNLKWTVNRSIVAALESAYYKAFDNVEPSGKKFLFGIDVSGSMSSTINNTNISCAEAAGCLAMTSVRTEPRTYTFGFCNKFVDLEITKKDSLAEVYKKVQKNNFGSTDCSVPMTHALENELDVDVFVVITDNETYAGRQHPHIVLNEYRRKMKKNAKLVVIGMTATQFSIADPNDPNSMDIIGFDSNLPSVLTNFANL